MNKYFLITSKNYAVSNALTDSVCGRLVACTTLYCVETVKECIEAHDNKVIL